MRKGRRAWSPAACAALVAGASLSAALVSIPVNLGPVYQVVFVASVAVLVAYAVYSDQNERRSRELRRLRSRLNTMADRLSGGVVRAADEPPAPGFRDVVAAAGRVAQAARVRTSSMEADVSELQAIFDAVAEPVLALEREGTVLLSNAPAERLLGRSPDRLLGAYLEDLFTNQELVELGMNALSGLRETRRLRLTLPGRNGVFEVTAEPAGAGDAVLTLRDVTELSNALQLRTDFVANASHELRTPLASIRAALETLRTWGEEDEATRDRLFNMIAMNTTRLEAMISDMLDLSRLESSEAHADVADVEFEMLRETMIDLFTSACADRGLRLEFDVDVRCRVIRTDRRLAELVLRNLIENATKFAYEGTPVVVRVAPAADPAGALLLEVTDRGIGIPIEQQPRVFERYFQVNTSRTGPPERRGTGLGLAIVKHAVRTLGGQVSVHSVWKEGTTMRVVLPRAYVEPLRG